MTMQKTPAVTFDDGRCSLFSLEQLRMLAVLPGACYNNRNKTSCLQGSVITMIEYKKLSSDDISGALFAHFRRRQVVCQCWRKVGESWCIRDVPFVDDWSREDYVHLTECLRNTIATGGMVSGAFEGGVLKGFVSVEPGFFGKSRDYLDLSSLHVSEDMRGNRIGSALFSIARKWAKEQGARKLYISAHSSVESQAFYHAMGCVEAQEYEEGHVEKEPYDCQLECLL